MHARKRIFLVLFVYVIQSSVLAASPVVKPIRKESAMNEPQKQKTSLMTNYTVNDIHKLTEVMKSTTRIIAQQSTFDKERKVMDIYIVKNWKVSATNPPETRVAGADVILEEGKSLDVTFERKELGSKWGIATITLYDKFDAPIIHVTPMFFDGLKLEKATIEKENGESVVFRYRLAQGRPDISFIFFVNPKFASTDDRYPKTFYAFSILNEKEFPLAPKP